MSHDAELEVAVYLRNFHNLDLFQQGWYSVRVTCFWESANVARRAGQPSRVVQYAVPDVKHGEAVTFWHINDLDSSFHSRPFRIRYTRQDVVLQEMISFHLSVGHGVQLSPAEDSVIVKFELLFGALRKDADEPPEELNFTAEHSFRILGPAWNSLHRFAPVTFDAWHFVLLEANVHTVLLSFAHSLVVEPSCEPPASEENAAAADNGDSAPAESSLDLAGPTARDFLQATSENGSQNSIIAGLDSTAKEEQLSSSADGQQVEELRTPAIADLQLLQLQVDAGDQLHKELHLYAAMAEESLVEIPEAWTSVRAERLLRAVQQSAEAGLHSNQEGAEPGRDANDNGAHTLALDGQASELLRDTDGASDISITPEEYLEEKRVLSAHISLLWNLFLTLHRLQQANISTLLRTRWEESRPMEAAQFVLGRELCMAVDDITGVDGGDWVGPGRDPSKEVLPKKGQEDRAVASSQRAELYRAGLAHLEWKHVPFQDMQLFGEPARQPILFVEHHVAALHGQPPKPSTPGQSPRINSQPGNMAFHRQRKGKHVLVLVHGFQGHHLDLRLLRNHWMILDPEIECIMSDANEERTFDGFAAMGQRLAEEVAGLLQNMFGAGKQQTSGRQRELKKLSFVGHSIGNLIIRAALEDNALAPYLPLLYTYMSVSAPHLGYLYSSNNLFKGGLWLLKHFNNAPVMHQLSFTDAPDIRDCYLFRLAQLPTLEHFQHVILFSSPQDRYVPYHSARIELCPAAMRDSKGGAAYASMVQGCLAPLLKAAASADKSLLRCDVNFDTSRDPHTLNHFLGRKAHIDFLETDVYIRLFLWAYRDICC